MRLSVSVGVAVEVATDASAIPTAWPRTLVRLERLSNHKVAHMRLELGQATLNVNVPVHPHTRRAHAPPHSPCPCTPTPIVHMHPHLRRAQQPLPAP